MCDLDGVTRACCKTATACSEFDGINAKLVACCDSLNNNVCAAILMTNGLERASYRVRNLLACRILTTFNNSVEWGYSCLRMMFCQ